MKKIPVLLVLLSAAGAVSGQNRVTIDLTKPVISPMTVDTTKALVVLVQNCDKAGLQDVKLEVNYKGADKPGTALVCEKESTVLLTSIFTDKKTVITFTVHATDKATGSGKTVVAFVVGPDEKLGPSQADQAQQPADSKVAKPLPEFPTAFVNPDFLQAVAPTSASKDCKYPIVKYDPCCNRYTLYDEGGLPTKYLRYHSNMTKNKGVVFLISDFNTLKYDITVGNTFSSNFTDVPGFFDQVFTLMAGGSTGNLASIDINPFADVLAKIVRLNKDLKQYLNKKMLAADCGGLQKFAKERDAILKIIDSVFGSLQFDKSYQDLKQAAISQEQKKTPGYTSDDFNTDVQKGFGLTATPDAIVAETQGLLDVLTTTNFEYQYNVPQIQNADSIVFTLNIAPKANTNGSIHVTNQPLSIPIKGGFKVDFSTGVYYSSIRNEKYALQDVTQGDTLVIGKKIVPDGGDKNGRSAVGINALAHITYRMGTVQPSLVLGLGSSLDLNYSLLIGAGVSIGRGNRIVLSGGLNYSSVKVLSDKYRDVTGQLLPQVKDVTSLDTYNKVRTGWFLGLTYSLGSHKSQAAAATGAATPADSGSVKDNATTDSGKDDDSSKTTSDTGGKGKKGKS